LQYTAGKEQDQNHQQQAIVEGDRLRRADVVVSEKRGAVRIDDLIGIGGATGGALMVMPINTEKPKIREISTPTRRQGDNDRESSVLLILLLLRHRGFVPKRIPKLCED